MNLGSDFTPTRLADISRHRLGMILTSLFTRKAITVDRLILTTLFTRQAITVERYEPLLLAGEFMKWRDHLNSGKYILILFVDAMKNGKRKD